jgi:hypothetical protein
LFATTAWRFTVKNKKRTARPRRRRKKIRINWRALRRSKAAVGGALVAFVLLILSFAGLVPYTIAGYKTMYLLDGAIAVLGVAALMWVDRSKYFQKSPPLPP